PEENGAAFPQSDGSRPRRQTDSAGRSRRKSARIVRARPPDLIMTGFLANGVWQRGWHDTRKTAGEFLRPGAAFRNTLPRQAIRTEPGRYCLYVSLACPWAHRTLIFRALKGLADALPVVVVDPVMDEDGWVFSEQFQDRLNGFTHLHQAYTSADPHYSGR